MSSDIPYDKMSSAPPAYDESNSMSSLSLNQVHELDAKQPAYNPSYPPQSHIYPTIPANNMDAMTPYNPAVSGGNPSASGPPYQPPVTQQPQNVVINMAGPGAMPFVGPRSMFMSCPNCHQQIKTETTTNYKCCATLCCCFMLCTGICTLFSCVPYCMDSCKIVHHKCPNCKGDLGVFQAS